MSYISHFTLQGLMSGQEGSGLLQLPLPLSHMVNDTVMYRLQEVTIMAVCLVEHFYM